jgi:hypothetical protein
MTRIQQRAGCSQHQRWHRFGIRSQGASRAVSAFVIGDGMFNIDTGVSKDFSLGEQRRLEFSWQAFNAINSVRYDVRGAQPALSYDPTQFGKYLNTMTTPRFMQFSLRFVF